MPISAAVAAGLISAGSQIASTGGNVLATHMTNKANQRLADQSYEYDTEMWNKSNLYNSPEAQMERLHKAGLNPNLVYGTGAVGNTSGQLPKYNAPKMEAPQIQFNAAEAITAYQNVKMQQTQINNIEQDTKNKALEAGIKAAQEAGMLIRNSKSQFDLDMAKTLKQNSLDLANYTLQKLKGDVSLQKLTKEQINQQIKNMKQTYNLTDAQIQVLKKQMENYNNWGTQNAPSFMGVPLEPVRKGLEWLRQNTHD